MKKIITLVMLFFIPANILAQELSDNNLLKYKTQNIELNYGNQTIIELSANNINRINVSPNRVKSIIGDSSEFSTILSDNHENIFFTSKLPVSESMDLSIIYTSGDVIDLRINIVDKKKPVIVNLTMPRFDSDDGSLLRKVNSMLDNMRMGMNGEHYVQHVDQELKLKGIGDAKCIHKKLYRYGKLHGSILEIKNKTKSKIKLNEKEFRSNFTNLLRFTAIKNIPSRSSITFCVIYIQEVE